MAAMLVRTRTRFSLSRRHAGISIALLLIGTYAEFGWQSFPIPVQAEVWNVCQAIAHLFLLGCFALAFRAEIPWAVAGLLGGFQLTTAGCGLAWLANPWPLVPGVATCSQVFQFPVGVVSCVAALIVAARVLDVTK